MYNLFCNFNHISQAGGFGMKTRTKAVTGSFDNRGKIKELRASFIDSKHAKLKKASMRFLQSKDYIVAFAFP